MISHPPIAIGQLAEHVRDLKANDNLKFSAEYESIDPGQQFTWEHSNLDVNKTKNRYANVIAYDHSRVRLQPLEGQPGSDYINANYIDGYHKQNAYVATQGPLPETFGDFWRLVWEQRSATVVMMTKLEERARVKCDQYWPTKGQETYDPITVFHLDTLELAYYTIRTFNLSRLGSTEKREVRHFQVSTLVIDLLIEALDTRRRYIQNFTFEKTSFKVYLCTLSPCLKNLSFFLISSFLVVDLSPFYTI